jgi:hypothetical protein
MDGAPALLDNSPMPFTPSSRWRRKQKVSSSSSGTNIRIKPLEEVRDRTDR